MSSEHFLSRWSRRKQEVRQTEQRPEDGPAQTDPAEPEGASETTLEESGRAASSEGELSADEIASLPSLEDLTADSDISVFLRKGVPEPLRNGALRRMWLLDPKIRDFVCEAREYAYDWNTPGGIPGFGLIEETADEVARMAAQIVGGTFDTGLAEIGKDAIEPTAPSKDREQPTLPALAESATRPPDLQNSEAPHPPLSTASGEAEMSGSPSRPADRSADLAPAARHNEAEEPASAAPPRRHGGALPL